MANLAARQHGAVAYRQLLELGFSGREIEGLVRTGRLHRVHRGVFAVGHPALTREGRCMAAVLACGSGALLSHWSAAWVWELLHPQDTSIDVLVPRHRRPHTGVRLRAGTVHRGERTIRDGIPITTVPRTLLDLAATANERQLRHATNEAARHGWLNARAIGELLRRHPRRRGVPALRAVLASVSPQTRRTRSDLEDLFLRVCRRYRLPTPISNAEIEGFEVDFHFPGTNLIVELDSYEYHRTPYEFDQDRRRDAQLKKHAYEVLRVSEMWLDSDPSDVAETIRELLGRCALARA